MSNHVGRFLWYDLNTTDVAGGKAFYTQVVGWTVTPFDGDYEMFTAESPIGGVAELAADAKAMGAPAHWLAYVGVADVDATVAKAQSLGGKAWLPGLDIPNVGRIAVLSDPDGAVFGIFQPNAIQSDPDAEAKVGEVSWHELMTSDHAAAFGFYQTLFGWQHTESMDMGPMGTYFMFGAGKHSLGGIMNRPPEMPASAWLYYVHVGDLDAALERVKAHGGMVLNGPMEVPGGARVAQCVDPQGAAFALHG